MVMVTLMMMICVCSERDSGVWTPGRTSNSLAPAIPNLPTFVDLAPAVCAFLIL